MKIKLSLPVKDVYVNQPFGENFVNFYSKMGLKGHNGIDFRTKTGCKVYAAHSGFISFAGKDGDGGISVTVMTTSNGSGYKTIYYHLRNCVVKKGVKVKEGDLVGYADNTGKYTTGDHLHFAVKEIYDGRTINTDNGYRGALNPSLYLPKNWDKSNAYHRYGRKGNYLAEIKVRFKNPWLHRQLIKRKMLYKVYDNEFINALCYGGWDFDSVVNPAMRDIWAWSKKDEFLRGKINFK